MNNKTRNSELALVNKTTTELKKSFQKKFLKVHIPSLIQSSLKNIIENFINNSMIINIESFEALFEYLSFAISNVNKYSANHIIMNDMQLNEFLKKNKSYCSYDDIVNIYLNVYYESIIKTINLDTYFNNLISLFSKLTLIDHEEVDESNESKDYLLISEIVNFFKSETNFKDSIIYIYSLITLLLKSFQYLSLLELIFFEYINKVSTLINIYYIY